MKSNKRRSCYDTEKRFEFLFVCALRVDRAHNIPNILGKTKHCHFPCIMFSVAGNRACLSFSGNGISKRTP